MFKSFFNKSLIDEQEEKDRLSSLSEKELYIEMIMELKKINDKCDDIARKIVVFGD